MSREVLERYLQEVTANYKILKATDYDYTIRPIIRFDIIEFTPMGGKHEYVLTTVELLQFAYIINEQLCILAKFDTDHDELETYNGAELMTMHKFYRVANPRAVQFIKTLNLLCERDRMWMRRRSSDSNIISLDGTNENTWKLVEWKMHVTTPHYYLQPDSDSWADENDVPWIYLPFETSFQELNDYIYPSYKLTEDANNDNEELLHQIERDEYAELDKQLDKVGELAEAYKQAGVEPIVAPKYAKGGVIPVDMNNRPHLCADPEIMRDVFGNIHRRIEPVVPVMPQPIERKTLFHGGPGCDECASYDLCKKSNWTAKCPVLASVQPGRHTMQESPEPATYLQALPAEFIQTIPNFVDTFHSVFKVTNIHFKVPTGEKLRVIKPFETFWKEYHPEATEEECHAHYVKTKLFYNYELKFDYAPVAYNTPEYKQAMRDHCSRKEFRCCADDADHIIPRRDASDDNDFYFYYHRPWMYVVIPNTYLHIVDTFVAGHCIQQIEEQMIWEYLRNTLKINVEYLYDDIIDEDDEQ